MTTTIILSAILIGTLLGTWFIHFVKYTKLHKFRIVEKQGWFTIEGKNRYVQFLTDEIIIVGSGELIRDNTYTRTISKTSFNDIMEIIDTHFEVIKKQKVKKKYYYINKK